MLSERQRVGVAVLGETLGSTGAAGAGAGGLRRGSPSARSEVAATLGTYVPKSCMPSTCFADVKGPSFALSHGRGFPTAPRECAHHSLISLSLLRREKQRESSGLQPGFRAPALPRGAAVMPSLLTPQTAKPILSILDHHRYSAGRRCAMTPRQECG